MQTIGDVSRFLARQRHIVDLLRITADIRAAEFWIGAGVLRNAIWDHLHDRSIDVIFDGDVDVVFFDTADIASQCDERLEAHLRSLRPEVPWSVHNQARMHLRNDDAPYRDVQDAIRHWPETATAIAARWSGSCLEMLAPHGIDDLVQLIVRPTPEFAHKLPQYRARVAAKAWAARWPRLKIMES